MHAELAIDYLDLRGLEAEKSLLDSTVTAYERALQLTTNRHDQGVASGVDVAQAQAQLDAARVQATDIAFRARSSSTPWRSSRARLLGFRDGAGAECDHASDDSRGLAAGDPGGASSELVERRPDVAAAERRVASANAAIGAAKAAYFRSSCWKPPEGTRPRISRAGSRCRSASGRWAQRLAETLFDAGGAGPRRSRRRRSTTPTWPPIARTS